MYKTNFRGLSLKAFNEREELNINSFKGADYSSSAFNVSDNRAIDILNLIFKDNVIQKRKGFKHVLSLTEKGKIHNIIKFQDGYVIHCGTKLYVANESFEITTQVSNATLLDKRVTMLEKNNRLYVLSGIKYFYLDNNFVVHNCEDDAYIPTTTIGIINSYNPIGTTNVSDINRTSLDKVNNLSNLVINELISGTRINNETKMVEFNSITKYKLDNDIDKNKIEDIKIDLQIDEGEFWNNRGIKVNSGHTGNGAFGICKFSANNSAWFNLDMSPSSVTINENKTFTMNNLDYELISGDYFIFIKSDNYLSQATKVKVVGTDSQDKEVWGYFYLVKDSEENKFIGLAIDKDRSDGNFHRILFYQDFEKKDKFPNDYKEVSRYEVTKINDTSEEKTIYENEFATNTLYSGKKNYLYYRNSDVESVKSVSGWDNKDFVITAYGSNDEIIGKLEF